MTLPEVAFTVAVPGVALEINDTKTVPSFPDMVAEVGTRSSCSARIKAKVDFGALWHGIAVGVCNNGFYGS